MLIFAGGGPTATPIPLVDGALELGREHPAFAAREDARMSRQHAVVRFDGRRFTVTDLRSRNGTVLDGQALAPGATGEVSRVIRVGDSLLLPVADTDPYVRLGVRVADERIEGPALQDALQAVDRAARLGSTLHITGESGAGKEWAARVFHAAGPAPEGPFVAVNCATIPEGVAERLLFGVRRGAFSGADADADGYLQAAHGGTLFLDEVAELSLAVQTKLLRALETGEVLQLGASRPRRIALRFCSATHRDLRAQVADGRLREDLFFRISTPRVVLPALRDRPEEIPWLLHRCVARVAPDCGVHMSLVEACLLRVWPGNIRELLAEARAAVQAALGGGAARVEARHLDASAGSAFVGKAGPQVSARLRSPASAGPPNHARATTPAPTRARSQGPAEPPSRATLLEVLERCGGNISAAARELGAHRTQFKRWMERYAIVGRAASADDDDDA